ncbi:Similar to exocyst complex component Sec8 [Aspergillus niger CBS 513.88]; acc. no. XP_001390302 [Pyronema omphalodes CBS 100304]|uniref:Similar to exocyst complex component Sec8 [Aspergillus niger CBS 513.88] acc. no. XP_001390302 n=1 Tax=Pyronema omphalodes (strain CBS 100304) TaxID=1076935 RepID=U4LIA4_PYROM|nr:Similar to exocyst complex component Sec8 [Aspergillus niger CBS 513.88]; acc. no. XP_001390302 [Pyronema omphalodes CBS 100304]
MIHVLILYKSIQRSGSQKFSLPTFDSFFELDGRWKVEESKFWKRGLGEELWAGEKKSKKLDALLRVIERDWSFMRDENCVPDLPVQVALQLMDTSSLGLGDWRSSTRTLRRGMKDLQLAKTGFAGYC